MRISRHVLVGAAALAALVSLAGLAPPGLAGSPDEADAGPERVAGLEENEAQPEGAGGVEVSREPAGGPERADVKAQQAADVEAKAERPAGPEENEATAERAGGAEMSPERSGGVEMTSERAGAVEMSPERASGLEGVEVREGRPRIWLGEARVEFLRDKYGRDPFEAGEDDPLAQALRYVLAGDEEAGRPAVERALEFDLPERVLSESVASDQYRWQSWVPTVADWCAPLFEDEERAAWVERYGRFAEAMNSKSWGGPQMPGSNYYSGYMRNSANYGLAAWGESERAEAALRDALLTRWRESSLPYYEDGARGGVVGEGSQYDRYNIGYVINFAEALRSGAGVNVYDETNFFREWACRTIYSTSPSPARAKGVEDPYYQRFPFGDCEFWAGYPAVDHYIGDAMRAISREYADERVGRQAAYYVEKTQAPRGLLGWVVEDSRAVEPEDFSSLPLDYFAPGAGFAYLRSGWGPSATAIMLQLGIPQKCSHVHLDLGSFQMIRGGDWMTKESTGYGHRFKGTAAREAPAHNTLLFDGRGRANAYLDAPPELLALETREKFFHAAVDLTGAYRARKSSHPDRDDNPSAGACAREFLFIRPDLLIVFDRMEATAPEVEKTFVLHFPHRPDEERGVWVMENGSSRFTAQVAWPVGTECRFVDEGDVEGEKQAEGSYQWRMEAGQSGRKKGCFLTVMAALERWDPPPSCEVEETEDSIRAVINQPGRRVIVTFKKDLAEDFGHLTIHAAGAYGHLERDLLRGVQPISVDGDGVHWGEFPDGQE